MVSPKADAVTTVLQRTPFVDQQTCVEKTESQPQLVPVITDENGNSVISGDNISAVAYH